jgi:phage terminase small subunit
MDQESSKAQPNSGVAEEYRGIIRIMREELPPMFSRMSDQQLVMAWCEVAFQYKQGWQLRAYRAAGYSEQSAKSNATHRSANEMVRKLVRFLQGAQYEELVGEVVRELKGILTNADADTKARVAAGAQLLRAAAETQKQAATDLKDGAKLFDEISKRARDEKEPATLEELNQTIERLTRMRDSMQAH